MPIIDTFSIDASEVIIWHITEPLNELIDIAEERKIDISNTNDYLSDLRKKQWIAVRIICKSKFPKIPISYEENGRPHLDQYKLSISHSNEYVAVSINNTVDTGIDLQIIDEKILKVYHKFVREDEDNWVNKDLTNATIVWSIKEAMYKLYGDCSPYFKRDYRVSIEGDSYVCKMIYKQEEIIRQVMVYTNPRYITAIVND